MDQIIVWIHVHWWWLGPALLAVALWCFVAALWDLVPPEIRWWKNVKRVKRETSDVKREA